MKLYLCYLFSIKLQREISDKIQLGETLNPLNSVSAVSSVDNTTNLKDVFGKVQTIVVQTTVVCVQTTVVQTTKKYKLQ